jgi:adenylate cyclase
VILLEDLHWIDPSSEALLARLVEALSATRTLLLVNHRPGYAVPWAPAPGRSALELLSLDPEAAQTLLGELLGSDPSLAPLAQRIQERAAGNPFFLEESVRSLAESGALAGERGHYRQCRSVESLEIPASIQSLLAARIDRLDEPQKQLLQCAAVIGERFDEELLARVAGGSDSARRRTLESLAAAELLVEEGAKPAAELRFRHSLTREVAYRSQLEATRARLHAAVARAIEERDGDRLGARAALLAHHWENAGELRRAGSWDPRAADGAGCLGVPGAQHHW